MLTYGELFTLIGEFIGNDLHQVHCFIEECDYAMDLATDEQKPILLKYISMKMKRYSMLLFNEDLPTWPELRKRLIDVTPKREWGAIISDFRNVIQRDDETVAAFAKRMESTYQEFMISAIWHTTKEEQEGVIFSGNGIAKHAFVTGLRDKQLRSLLGSWKPSSLEDAMKMAIVEELEDYQDGATKPASNYCMNCKKGGHTTEKCYWKNGKNNRNNYSKKDKMLL